jgi:hypothetical protein
VSAVITGGGITGTVVSAGLISLPVLSAISSLIKGLISFSGIRLSTEGRLRSHGRIYERPAKQTRMISNSKNDLKGRISGKRSALLLNF